ncbi:MAG TPA: hypothetical protein VGJ20_43260 [Xanthobacteraceae bacterium]|jgi:hypothetical protein
MAEKISSKEPAAKSSLSYPFAFGFVEFTGLGSKRIATFAGIQMELFNQLQASNRRWFNRVQSDANLASEFASKLTAAHSLPEAMTACQQWSDRRLKLMAEVGQDLIADAQRFMATSARMLSNGRQ